MFWTLRAQGTYSIDSVVEGGSLLSLENGKLLEIKKLSKYMCIMSISWWFYTIVRLKMNRKKIILKKK
jgi:hypothetical protein